MTTYYDILGVEPTACADEIKAAYRRLAMQFHPDKTPGANKAVQRLIEDKFKEIQEAYDTLRDEAKRAEYDAALEMLRSEEYYEPPPPPPPPKPRYCPRCHKPVPASAPTTDRFCTFCGASLQSSTRPPEQKQQPQQQSQSKRKTPVPTGKPVSVGVTVFAVLCGLLIWLAIAGIIQAVFPRTTDGAAFSSALFFVAAPFVLWACVTKARMKWPMPALAPFLMVLFIAAAIISTGEEEIPQHPPTPVSAVHPQTSEASGTEVQSPLQAVSPQPGNKSAGASKGHPVSVSAHEPGCAVSEEAKKLGFVPDSCKGGQTWVEIVKQTPANKQAVDHVPLASPSASQGVTGVPTVTPPQRLDFGHTSVGDATNRDNNKVQSTAPATGATSETNTVPPGPAHEPASDDLSRLSWDDRQSIEIACAGDKAEGPAAYHRCLEDQLGRLAAGPRMPDLSRLSWDDRQSIEIACAGDKAEGPAAYHKCVIRQLGLIEHHRR